MLAGPNGTLAGPIPEIHPPGRDDRHRSALGVDMLADPGLETQRTGGDDTLVNLRTTSGDGSTNTPVNLETLTPNGSGMEETVKRLAAPGTQLTGGDGDSSTKLVKNTSTPDGVENVDTPADPDPEPRPTGGDDQSTTLDTSTLVSSGKKQATKKGVNGRPRTAASKENIPAAPSTNQKRKVSADEDNANADTLPDRSRVGAKRSRGMGDGEDGVGHGDPGILRERRATKLPQHLKDIGYQPPKKGGRGRSGMSKA